MMADHSLIRRVFADQHGTSGIEFALVFPVILLLFMGAVTLFDGLRSYSKVVEANGIVSDMISRQTTVNDSFLSNLYGIFSHLQADDEPRDALRISSIITQGGKQKVAWSKSYGASDLLQGQAFDTSNLPSIPEGDSLIYVEGMVEYQTITQVLGYGTFLLKRPVSSRPRFISAVGYSQ